MVKKIIFFLFINFTFLFMFNVEKTIYTTYTNDFYNLIAKYKSFNIDKINEYYEVYITNNNIIYTLNKVNYPNFYYDENKYKYFLFDNFIFVNKSCVLCKDYVPKNLVPVSVNKINRAGETMLIDKETHIFLEKMFKDAKRKNLDLTVFSAYRSFYKQHSIYNLSSDKAFVAIPGTSEHQTGMAVDISTKDTGLSIHFENTDEFLFLKNNSYKYGFILRYPKDLISITGYPYESWHYRYVGVELATFLHDFNLTLEEYLYMYVELNLHKIT